MATLTDRQAKAIKRIQAAASVMELAADQMLEAIAEMQLAAAELEPHRALNYELIAIQAIARARTKEG